MKVLNKKRGSSLVIVLMAFSILTVVGLAMLTLTLSSYKLRSVEGKAKMNFYLSEGGIEEAYGVLSNFIDSAVTYGNTAVDNYMRSLNLDNERKSKLAGSGSSYINDDGTTNEEYIKQRQNEVFQDAYKLYFVDNKETIKNSIETHDYKLSSGGTKPKVIVKAIDNEFNNTSWNVSLQSTFEGSSIKKILSSTYEISIPNYNESYYVETKSLGLPKSLVWSNSITADGDMNIASSEVNISGDVYVKGNDTNVYNRGITLKGVSPSLAVNGVLSTAGKLQASAGASSITVNGSIYAGDVSINKGAEGSNLTVNTVNDQDGNMYTNNDLALNANSSQINIFGGFYGVSDGSDQPDPDKSSSIKINATDLGAGGSRLRIAKDGLIMGTSYVSTENKYQTAESLSIKGNYIAYTSPLTNGDYASNNIIFEYFNPLRFASKFSNENSLIVFDKIKYFQYYLNEYGLNSGLNLGTGIQLDQIDKIKHTGIIVSGGKVYPGNIDGLNDDRYIKNQQDELKSKIYLMNSDKIDGLDSVIAPQKTVANMVNFSELQNRLDYANGTLLVLNNNVSKSYALIGPGADTSSIPASVERINLSGDEVKGIILTRGDLYICGQVRLAGTIITGGNLNILDNNNKEINYDETYVSRFIAYNYDLFKNVFINNSAADTKNIEISSNLSKDNNIGTDIARNKLIKLKNWTIEK